jgi:N utilization substance protein A
MNIDMAALRSLEREKDVSLELLIEAIESALLAAYQRSEGAQPQARVVLDRATGEVVVLATETDE